MTEFELKLEVPAVNREGVALAFSKARRKRLQARYFDTDKRALAGYKVVVRVRKEGTRWVQTAKASSGNSLERLEHNVDLPRPATGSTPAIDLSRHAGTPLEARLREALGLQGNDPFPALSLVFATDVQRQVLEVKAGSSMVEIAFDQGRVSAGERHAELCELEFELKSGKPQEAIRLARRWCIRHGLWLSSISKSAKGQRLSERAEPSATGAAPVVLPGSRASVGETTLAMVANCIEQVLPNASEIATGGNNREQIHQLRVGLRRLRSVLRELGDSGGAIDAAWEPELARVFRILGEHRDNEFLNLQMQPQLVAAGGPTLDAGTAASPPDPGEAVRSAAFQATVLDLLAFTHGRAATTPAAREPALAAVRSRLKKLQRQIIEEGPRFLALDETARHRLRKRIKRLRYLAELAGPLFKRKNVERFLAKLKPAQDSLGLYNDRRMALAAYDRLAQSNPKAWFGVGWLSAHRQEDATACQRDLLDLAKLTVFW